MKRGVVSAASYEARKFGVHSALPLRTAAKLCPQAIFVDGHPERYRECSEKSLQGVDGVFSAGGDGFDRRSLSRYDRDGAAAGPPLRAAHKLHARMERRDAAELLDRYWVVAADCESFVGAGEA